MKKIVFINVGGQGHVLPTLGTLAELVTAGFHVTYCCLPDFRASIEGIGAAFVPYDSELSQPPPAGAKPGTQQLLARLASDGLFVAEQLFAKVAELQPDLLVYDEMAIAGRVLAEALNINSAVLHSTYAANERFSLYRDDCGIPAAARASGRAFCQQLGQRFGIRPPDADDLLRHPAPLHIVYMPRELHLAAEYFPASHHFVGPGVLGASRREDGPRIEADILVSMGTVFNRWVEGYRIVMEALGSQPWRVAMAIGKRVQLAELGVIPQRFTVAAHLPQLQILACSRLAILHGGMGSTVEALSMGVLLIVIPQIPEQVLTGRQVASLGLGQMIKPEDLTVGALRECVDQLLGDAELHARAARMGATISSYGGSKQAARLLAQAASENVGSEERY